MADKAAVYNAALLLLGQRALSSTTEDTPNRYYLDTAYDLGAESFVLELIRPKHASLTALLNSPAVSSVHALDSVHTLPADFITVVGVYSDDKLDEPVSRYLIEGNTLVCEFDVVYLRYTSDSYALSTWSLSSINCLVAYLAREISIKVDPEEYATVDAKFADRVAIARSTDGEVEPDKRSTAPATTLTAAWMTIYNDALLIMGLDEITTINDDSNRRVKLDVTINGGLVGDLLEDIGWQFALTSDEVTYNSSIEPEWGYQYAFDKPAALARLDGLYVDDYMQVPLRLYHDEADRWYCDHQTIYAAYVSTAFLNTPSSWPTWFARLVAGKMAMDAAPSLRKEGSDVENANFQYQKRYDTGLSNDAQSSPPRREQQGRWASARLTGYRSDRP